MRPPAAERAAAHPVSFGLAAIALALMPAYVIRPRVGPLPTTVLEIALLATIAAFLVESALARSFSVPRTGFEPAMGLFLLAGVFAIFASPDRYHAAGLFRAYLLEPVLFFLLLTSVISSRRRVVAILGGLAAGGLVVAVLNLAAFSHAALSHQSDLAVYPPVAIYTSANDTALFLVPLLAVGAAVALFADARRLQFGAALFSAAALLAILLSFSRGGYLALIALLIGLTVAHRRRLRLLLGGAIAIAIALLVPPVRTRIAHELTLGPHNSIPGRLGLWEATLRMLHDHPIFGAGLSGFAQVMAPYHPPAQPACCPLIYPHTILLNFWAVLGLLGLAGFAWLTVLGFRQALSGARRGTGLLRAVPLGVCLALVAIVVHGLVDVPFFKNDLSLQYFALLGLQWTARRLH